MGGDIKLNPICKDRLWPIFRMGCGHIQYVDTTKSHLHVVLNPSWTLTIGKPGTTFLPLPHCPAHANYIVCEGGGGWVINSYLFEKPVTTFT